jgi:hypothetical protein
MALDRVRARRLANTVNLSTPLGLAVARLGGARRVEGTGRPDGLLVASGYRRRLPRAAAFTVGDVVVTRLSAEQLAARPLLLQHEARHAAQWACWLGPPFLPAYLAAAGWSLLRTGDPASRNAFERRAGLAAGGYRERPVHRIGRGGPRVGT